MKIFKDLSLCHFFSKLFAPRLTPPGYSIKKITQEIRPPAHTFLKSSDTKQEIFSLALFFYSPRSAKSLAFHFLPRKLLFFKNKLYKNIETEKPQTLELDTNMLRLRCLRPKETSSTLRNIS